MKAVIYTLACAVGLVAGCLTMEEEFACGDDDQCVMNGEQGQCESNGWCSFRDHNCPSKWRYAELARPGLAGYCVPAERDEPEGETESG
jgi:hypothetical protein